MRRLRQLFTLLFICTLGVFAALPQPAEPQGAKEDDRAVRAAIASELDSSMRGGKLEILDPRSGQARTVTFVELHDAVHRTGDGSAYACADFKDESGKLYDVDVYVRGEDGGYRLKELVLHKADGKDRIREPKGAQAPPPGTARGVHEAIGRWIDREAALRNGAFPFYDPRAGKLHASEVVSLHPGVHATGDGLYYACLDVRAEGKLYDLDIYARPAGDDFEVAEVLVHKVDGKDRLR